MSTFLLGINYWPRRSAMYMWERFDRGEIREDMLRIRDIGLKVVRFFLRWDAFQPQPDIIDQDMLKRLDAVMDEIANAQLYAMPTFFTGHMSGVNWLPEWTLDPATSSGRFRTYCAGMRQSGLGIGNFYIDPLLRTQRLQVRTVGARYRNHPALFVWDLGNEFSNLREPDTPAQAAHWSEVLTHDLLETSDVGVTSGTHGEDITRDRHIRLSSLCAPYVFATMHGYSVYSAFARGRLDGDVVPFLFDIAESCSGKRVLFSEFGNPACPPGTVSPYDRVPLPGEKPPEAKQLPANAAPYACLCEDEMAEYGYAVLERLQKRGALGAFWWCWADYDERLASLPPFDRATHELRFGIIRSDGTEKPVAEMLRGFVRENRPAVEPGQPFVSEDSYFAGLPQNVDATYRKYVERYP
ncbi:MAG: beta-galactosidase [Candidatus Eremiobacteraeota bacterium]|nr:beta-galactosidase [Candidatus Eremiobacteraeota bacterium]